MIIKAANPGLFIILNYTLLSCIVMLSVLSSCAAAKDEQACTVMSYSGALVNCVLLIYVWYKLFTWKC
jgi:hypothetical protein